MADFTTLGDDEKLKIKVPVKGATNWADTMKSDTFQKIADHDHSGADGKGAKISKVGKDSEDTFIDGENKIHMEKPVRFVPGNPPANPAIGDTYVDSNGVLYIYTKTGQACSLSQYADKATCIAGGGEWTEGTWETASATTSVQGASDTQFTVDTGAATDIAQDQLLSWDNAAGQKKFKPVDRVISTLNDVDTTGVTDNALMAYDSATSKWKPENRADLMTEISTDSTVVAAMVANAPVQSAEVTTQYQTKVLSSDLGTYSNNSTLSDFTFTGLDAGTYRYVVKLRISMNSGGTYNDIVWIRINGVKKFFHSQEKPVSTSLSENQVIYFDWVFTVTGTGNYIDLYAENFNGSVYVHGTHTNWSSESQSYATLYKLPSATAVTTW